MSKKIDIERGLLSKLIQTKKFDEIEDRKIKLNYFSGDAKNVFRFIKESMIEKGEMPTARVMRNAFPYYTFDTIEINNKHKIGTEESLKYWCDELRKKVKHNTLAENIEEIAVELDNKNTEVAYEKIKKTIAYIENEVVESTEVDITQDIERRKEIYLERKKHKGITGVRTGINFLDRTLKGINKGTLTVIAAPTSYGKTWVEVLIGANCMLENYRVLHLMTEMDNDAIRDRYEAILFSKVIEPISYSKLKSGMLPVKQERKFFEFLENELPNLEPLILDTATSPLGVRALIDKHSPDIILIDGMYLMEDDRRAKDDWLRVTNITRDLKKICKDLGARIVVNTQLDIKKTKSTKAGLENLSYSQSTGFDADNVFSLYRDDVMFNEKEMGIRILKNREGALAKGVINWNFDEMNFEEVYSEESEDYSSEYEKEEEDVVDDNVLDIY